MRPAPNKALGQHYLHERKTIEAITSTFPKAKHIIEIGPGPSVLTPYLAKRELPLEVVERDLRFRELLEATLDPSKIHFCDAMDVDWKEFLGEREDVLIVSNLPYNISAPLTLKLLRAPQVRYMTLMYQKEVGDKFTTTELNTLNFQTNGHFKANRLITVPPGQFHPPPKVDSVVVNFERRLAPEVEQNELPKLEEFARQIFSSPRKQLFKRLRKLYSNCDKVVEDLGLAPNARVQELSFSDALNLFRQLKT